MMKFPIYGKIKHVPNHAKPSTRVYIHQVIYDLPKKNVSPSESKVEVTGWTEHDLHLRVIAIDVMSDQQQKWEINRINHI